MPVPFEWPTACEVACPCHQWLANENAQPATDGGHDAGGDAGYEEACRAIQQHGKRGRDDHCAQAGNGVCHALAADQTPRREGCRQTDRAPQRVLEARGGVDGDEDDGRYDGIQNGSSAGEDSLELLPQLSKPV